MPKKNWTKSGHEKILNNKYNHFSGYFSDIFDDIFQTFLFHRVQIKEYHSKSDLIEKAYNFSNVKEAQKAMAVKDRPYEKEMSGKCHQKCLEIVHLFQKMSGKCPEK